MAIYNGRNADEDKRKGDASALDSPLTYITYMLGGKKGKEIKMAF